MKENFNSKLQISDEEFNKRNHKVPGILSKFVASFLSRFSYSISITSFTSQTSNWKIFNQNT